MFSLLPLSCGVLGRVGICLLRVFPQGHSPPAEREEEHEGFHPQGKRAREERRPEAKEDGGKGRVDPVPPEEAEGAEDRPFIGEKRIERDREEKDQPDEI